MAQPPTELEATIAVVGGVLTGIAAFRVPRRDLDRIPLTGLGLVAAVNAIVGWAFAIAQAPITYWLSAAVAVVAVGMVRSIQLGRGGVIAFGLAGISAIVWGVANDQVAQIASIALLLLGVWLWAFGGARYRMERAGFDKSIRWTLAIVGWEGLWLGWLIHTFVAPQVGVWFR
jgi:hypothetical protein